MMIKHILLNTSVFIILLTYNLLAGAVLPAGETDSAAAPKYKWEDVFISVKAGSNVYDPSDNLHSGFTANAGLGVGIGSGFYIKPSVLFLQAKTNEKHSITEHSIGYLLSIETIMHSDGFNLSVSCGAGSFSLESSKGQPGVLAELGILIPVSNMISAYAGGGYLAILSLDFGGTENGYTPFTLSAGFYFDLE